MDHWNGLSRWTILKWTTPKKYDFEWVVLTELLFIHLLCIYLVYLGLHSTESTLVFWGCSLGSWGIAPPLGHADENQQGVCNATLQFLFLLRTLCFPVFTGASNICCGHKKRFWFCSETFCVRNKCFQVCKAWKHKIRFVSRAFARPRNIMSNNVSATVCPRLPRPVEYENAVSNRRTAIWR